MSKIIYTFPIGHLIKNGDNYEIVEKTLIQEKSQYGPEYDLYKTIIEGDSKLGFLPSYLQYYGSIREFSEVQITDIKSSDAEINALLKIVFKIFCTQQVQRRLSTYGNNIPNTSKRDKDVYVANFQNLKKNLKNDPYWKRCAGTPSVNIFMNFLNSAINKNSSKRYNQVPYDDLVLLTFPQVYRYLGDTPGGRLIRSIFSFAKQFNIPLYENIKYSSLSDSEAINLLKIFSDAGLVNRSNHLIYLGPEYYWILLSLLNNAHSREGAVKIMAEASVASKEYQSFVDTLPFLLEPKIYQDVVNIGLNLTDKIYDRDDFLHFRWKLLQNQEQLVTIDVPAEIHKKYANFLCSLISKRPEYASEEVLSYLSMALLASKSKAASKRMISTLSKVKK